MKKIVSLLIIVIFAISLSCGCLETSYVSLYNDHVEGCQEKYIIYDAGTTMPIPKQVTLPYTFSVFPCNPNNAREDFQNAFLCTDFTGCTPGQECNGTPCSNFILPSNYRCQVRTLYRLQIDYALEGTIYVNGIPFVKHASPLIIDIVENEGDIISQNKIVGIPSSITITAAPGASQEAVLLVTQICCYECRQKSIPAAILYPKVDIEAFQIVGGDTIIQDGKVLSSFNISPGTQQTEIQIENRGFFTQNDVRVRVDGLPQGITLDLDPGVQKIKAHKIGTYNATFSVDPDVPSGRYPVVMTAFSLNGTFDRIIVEVVVP